jgi:hypothetical protein
VFVDFSCIESRIINSVGMLHIVSNLFSDIHNYCECHMRI